VEQIEDLGLALSGLEEGLHPILLNAGRQYLALAGDVEVAVLPFLPSVIDDLHARRALLYGGTVLVDEFRAALLTRAGVGYAREIVPPAFVPAVDERLALDLFPAAVALTARLSAGRPAGCVAEEILAVALLQGRTPGLRSSTTRMRRRRRRPPRLLAWLRRADRGGRLRRARRGRRRRRPTPDWRSRTAALRPKR
jgi:hypothetical protein